MNLQIKGHGVAMSKAPNSSAGSGMGERHRLGTVTSPKNACTNYKQNLPLPQLRPRQWNLVTIR
jgi:hypothetical protein